MKILILILFSTTIAFGQIKSKSLIAQKNVMSYLRHSLNDPQSYRPVSWTQLSVIKSDYNDSKAAKFTNKKIDSLLDESSALKTKVLSLQQHFVQSDAFNRDSLIEYCNKQILLNDKTIEQIKTLESSYKKVFKPAFENYYIEHTFRARNAYNGQILKTYIFILNRSLNVVESEDKEVQKARYDAIVREASNL
jgi:hypothetical protein